MLPTQSPSPNELPPIVLLVDDDRDTLSTYSAYFETAGVWVATSTAPSEALGAVQELKPDLIVTDIGFAGDPLGVDLVHTLKTRSDTAQIPLILLSGGPVPPETRQEADTCLVKPVQPLELLSSVRRLLAVSRELCVRGDNARARTKELVAKSNRLLDRSSRVIDRVQASRRSCPNCSAPLDWIERGRIGGAEYDYYRWCAKGCGLYCFELDSQKWVKLA